MLKVNEMKKVQEYVSKKAVENITDNINKKQLTADPFLRFFEYGKNHSGYCGGDHAAVQMKNFIYFISFIFK